MHIPTMSVRTCAACGKACRLKCRCGGVYYCARSCQVADRKRHAPACSAAPRRRPAPPPPPTQAPPPRDPPNPVLIQEDEPFEREPASCDRDDFREFDRETDANLVGASRARYAWNSGR